MTEVAGTLAADIPGTVCAFVLIFCFCVKNEKALLPLGSRAVKTGFRYRLTRCPPDAQNRAAAIIAPGLMTVFTVRDASAWENSAASAHETRSHRE
jgi:hypothetical protein